ncbi:energy transducer TonB [Pedobacter sp. SYSU D00535]|uniref:energy transducer TonB n=1 Tax=Pedobacter sp. SYSU D00535 TaxID=2810308 RepID=UPI001A95C587|nr:energy transducer TonB [Pedobacter sp. SYSU D00535]
MLQFTCTLLLILLSVNLSFAQRTFTHFVDKSGMRVKTKEEAEYIREITDSAKSKKVYSIREFYKTGQVRRVGEASRYEPLTYTGEVKTYFQTGELRSTEVFLKGFPSGVSKFYYRSGALQKLVMNVLVEDSLKKKKSTIKRLLSYADSTGHMLVVNGSGRITDFDEDVEVWEEGEYLDGMKNGTWKGKSEKPRFEFEEKYDKGVLISGTSKDSMGQVHEYIKLQQQPSFNGGMENFYQWVGRNFRYPREALQQGVSGRLLYEFWIEPDGSLSNITLLSDPGMGTGQAGFALLRKSPKWTAGRIRGIPVRVKYTLPIALNLERG